MDVKSSPVGKKRKLKDRADQDTGKKKKKKRRKKEKSSSEKYVQATKDSITVIGDDRGLLKSYNTHTEPTKNNPLDDWFSPLHHLGGKSTAKKLRILEAQGITPVKGSWSSEEVNKLHENMMDFLMANEVKDFKRLIIPATPEDRKFRLDTQFGKKMCRGIQRTYHNIIAKVLYQYSNFLTQGRYSEEEKKELVKLRNSGKSWKEIGLTMNRIHIGMATIHAGHSKMWNKGPWTREEDQLLCKAVAKFKMASDDSDKGTWNQVSEFVGTRPPVYCNNRWWRTLSKKENLTENIQFTDDDAMKLVSEVNESGVDDEYLIDWISLSEMFDISVTPKWLRWKWGVLAKEVPRSQYLEFPAVIEELYALYQKKKQEKTGSADNTEDSPTNNEKTDILASIIID